MSWLSHRARMPAQADALPGRSVRMPVSEKHFVLGTPLEPPFPDGHLLAARTPTATKRPGAGSCSCPCSATFTTKDR